jgi:hypothetical protein
MVIQRSYDEVARRLAECLNSLAGSNKPQEIHPDLDALRQWGLDSEDGVDVAAEMASQLGLEIPHDENPLVAESKTGQKCARSFKEVVQYLLRSVEAKEQ